MVFNEAIGSKVLIQGGRSHPSYDKILAALRRLKLTTTDYYPTIVELSGGISSEIYKVALADKTICVKLALPTLKNDPDWHVPVIRSAAEAEWIKLANSIKSHTAPQLLGYDHTAKLIAMDYLDPRLYPNWKEQLRDGNIEPRMARDTAKTLVTLHNFTAGDSDIAARFANDEVFFAIRLEAYFLITGSRIPDVMEPMRSLVETTRNSKCALVHGDVSPKNILLGRDGPIFLDAECAWYGEPAFDAAFCLTHFLMKCLWRPHWSKKYLECFYEFSKSYLTEAAWLDQTELEARIIRLLVGMLLARVVGRSPVEYVTEDDLKRRVCKLMIPLVHAQPSTLVEVVEVWRKEFVSE